MQGTAAAVASAAKRVDEQRSIGRTRDQGREGQTDRGKRGEVFSAVSTCRSPRRSEKRAGELRSKERGRDGSMVRGISTGTKFECYFYAAPDERLIANAAPPPRESFRRHSE